MFRPSVASGSPLDFLSWHRQVHPHLDAYKLFQRERTSALPFLILKRTIMTKFKCPCKYTYDPEKGDPKQNIPPGTPFEELPDTWRCPRCKRKKEKFVPVEE